MIRLALHGDPSAMVAHDSMRYGETKPGPLAHLLRREERIEHARQVLLADARTLIPNVEAKVDTGLSFVPCGRCRFLFG